MIGTRMVVAPRENQDLKGRTMMNIRTRIAGGLLTLGFVSISALSISAQQFSSSSIRATTLPPASNITTLYSNDPIAHSLCFADGREGGVMQNGGVFNRCSH